MSDERQIFIEPNEAYDAQSKCIAYLVNDLSAIANADDNDLDPAFTRLILNACLMLINCDKDRTGYHAELVMLGQLASMPKLPQPQTGASTKSQQCCVPTKNGKQCRVEADREHDGLWYCHLHDPHGNNQRRNKGKA